MPPKKGAKKAKGGKNLDDDDYWEQKAGSSALASPALEDAPAKVGKKSAFDLLEEFEAGGGKNADDDEGGGGLLSAMRSRKDRKKPRKTTPLSDDDEPEPTPAPVQAAQASIEDEWPEEDVKPKKGGKKGGKANNNKKGGKKQQQQEEEEEEEEDLNNWDVPLSAAVPVVADLDEEWPEEDIKPKKGGKKDKKKNKKQQADSDSEAEPTVAETPAPGTPSEPTPPPKAAPAPVAAADPPSDAEDEDQEGGEVKILSKKEKEKLKKEKEKAKKKAQAAKKKEVSGGAGGDVAVVAEEKVVEKQEEKVVEATKDEEDDEGDDAEGAGGADKKKKKKKKKAAAPEIKEEPKKKGKVNAQVAALQAALERKQALEAEQKRLVDEERQRVEAEEARIEEEERQAEEARAAKREKEKAKRELAKKEGRLLTPKQKAEKAAAEARMQALLASGLKVAGLEEGGAQASEKKKVVYGNKKKPSKKPDPAAGPKKVAAEILAAEAAKPAQVKAPADDDEDDWDKSGDEKVVEVTKKVAETKIADDDEDDWDKSDEDEDKVESAPAPVVKPAATNGDAKPKTNGKPAAKPAAAAEESSSEEDSDSDDSDDSDDSSDDDSSDESDSEDEMTPAQRKAMEEAEQRKADAAKRRQDRHTAALAARSKDDLRSPICCILGHVDTGKTKLLDKIRQTNVQEGEAGGITQQIGATYFPISAIKEKTAVVNQDGLFDYKIPGLLIIDTPGHESFTNLRTRGSSLCNIAILVVDITHGLEPQTLESIRLLKERKTPFIVALNKIDRCYGWQATPDGAFRESLAKQTAGTRREFENRLAETKVAFAEQGFNAVLFDENKDVGRNVSLVPTSAITGEGIPDMIMLLTKLTQQRMTDRLMYLSELECTVLEVKVIEGLGTTIDVILSNGVMREGDRIVVCGLNGPIVTNVRALLTPQPLRELRVKSAYVHNKEVKAALGIKISAPGLEKAIAGSRLLVVGPDDDEEDLMDEVMSDLKGLEEYVDKSGKGVWVQASTLGSLEALLEFLRSSKIPVMGINIGPVYKRDIMRCAAMLEKAPEYAVVLCFDVGVDKEARSLSDELGVKVFEAQIIYHLFDAFTAYMANVLELRRKDAAPNAVWPCRLKIIAAFAKRDPIVVGVDIIEGTLRNGTPLCVVKVDKETGKKEIITLGKITSIEINHVVKDVVKKSQIGGGAAIKIEHAVYQSSKAYGRHFDDSDELVSQISRQSIDVLKTTFREQVELSDWALIKALKPKLNID